jgi:ComEC/Rec2-related protein
MRHLYAWGDAGGFLLALGSANRDYLSPGLAEDFRRTGLAHIIALSGSHLSLLGLLSAKTGRGIGGYRLSLVLPLIASSVFVWFAGGSPSLNRALIMFALGLCARELGFALEILPLLAATAVIQLILMPAEALSLAFFLSCTALWGILTFGEALASLLEVRIPVPLQAGFPASVGAQFMTAPVLALTVKVLSPVGILASCLASPLSSLYLVAGTVLAIAAAIFPPLSAARGSALSASCIAPLPIQCISSRPATHCQSARCPLQWQQAYCL